MLPLPPSLPVTELLDLAVPVIDVTSPLWIVVAKPSTWRLSNNWLDVLAIASRRIDTHMNRPSGNSQPANRVFPTSYTITRVIGTYSRAWDVIANDIKFIVGRVAEGFAGMPT
jgi:hypothetical protein